jgi:hypothetical protein
MWKCGSWGERVVLKFVEDLQINCEVEGSSCSVVVTDIIMNITFGLDVSPGPFH